MQIIGDYYVIHKKRAMYMHVAMLDCKTFALKKRYLHGVVFPKYPDFYQRLSERSYDFYKHWIHRPIAAERRIRYEDINQARLQTSLFYINDNTAMRASVPSRQDYLNYVHTLSLDSRNKRKLRGRIARLLTGGAAAPRRPGAGELVLDEGEQRNTDKYFEAINTVAARMLDRVRAFYEGSQAGYTEVIK